MSGDATALYDREGYGDAAYRKTVIVSVLLHVVLLIVIPILSGLLERPKKYERPHTFELVSAPLPPPPAPVTPAPVEPTPAPAPPVPTPAPQPVPTQQPTPPPPQEVVQPRAEPVVETPPTPAPREEQVTKRVEEDLTELASLFEALPAPVSVRAPSDFEFAFYLNQVRSIIERNWQPATENRNLSVTVNFTINRDGVVSGLTIESSSGNATLDRLAMRAVQVSSFPRLPPAFTGDQIVISCVLRPTRR